MKKAAVIFAIILCFLYSVPHIQKAVQSGKEAKEKVDIIYRICEHYGLDDVEVHYDRSSSPAKATIFSSNFHDLTFEQMLSLDESLAGTGLRAFVCGEDRYSVSYSTRHITKNGEELYDDYWHSETHVSTSSNRKTGSSNYSAAISEKEKEELYYVAKSFVKSHLKSPSSAKFALSYECSYGKGTDNVYNIVGWVESKNSYGEKIRETWSCMIERNGNRASLVMLDIEGKVYFD